MYVFYRVYVHIHRLFNSPVASFHPGFPQTSGYCSSGESIYAPCGRTRATFDGRSPIFKHVEVPPLHFGSGSFFFRVSASVESVGCICGGVQEFPASASC